MKEIDHKKYNKIMFEIQEEFFKATNNFSKFNSAHEGYAILLEEVDELWENVKLNQSDIYRKIDIKNEAIQVATMAIRLIYDCCEGETRKYILMS